MLAVTRFRAPEPAALTAALDTVVAALSARPGILGAQVGRNADDPELWVLVTTWADVGSYRRALSAYDVKVAMAPLQASILDEPSAYLTYSPGEENLPRELA